MEEKTLFKLARAITDTGTDTVSSKGGTVTYRITSLKRELVNGKVTRTSTPSCSLDSASISWATYQGITVGDGYLDVKINYSENTGSSRSATLIFSQDESNNKINLTVTQSESSVTYTGYIKMIADSLPLGASKGDIALILVIAYLNGSDGSKKPETPHVGSAPDWCSVSIRAVDTENHYMISLTALSSNQPEANRSGHLFLTCGDANLSIPVIQLMAKITNNITISVFKSLNSSQRGQCDIRSSQPVAHDIAFRLQIQYGVSSGDVKEYNYTLVKDSTISRNNFALQNEADPQLIDYSYSPREDSTYIYEVSNIINPDPVG